MRLLPRTLTRRGLLLAAAVSTTLPLTAWAGEPGEGTLERWDSAASWDIPGEYVVDFQDDVAESTIQSVLSTMGLTFRETALEDDTRIEIVQVSGRAQALLDRLRGDGRVEGVEPHAKVAALFVPNDPMFGEQWHLSRVQAEAAWSFSVGRGVTVAVIDTGIACQTFEEFTKATDLQKTRCVAGYNFVTDSSHANDDHGHGTHVAGTIAQSTNNGMGVAGLAFGARLMPVKVLTAGGWGTTTAVADGIRWAADHGAQVINLSLGGPRNSRILQRAVDYARAAGVVIVAAAGNTGGPVGYPGGCEGVIGVSATTPTDQLAWFSSRGQGVDIAAPGVDVLQQTVCDHGRNACEIFPTFSGTSMASPHVAGAAALIVSLGITEPAAVAQQLTETARKLASSEEGGGAGLLQAAAAVERGLWRQTLTRLGALLAFALLAVYWAKRRGPTAKPTHPGFWIAALTTGVGLLFFAPWVLSRHHLFVDLLSRPLGDWDLLLSASAHSYLPLANLLVPLGLTLALYSIRGSLPWLAGAAVGTGSYLVSALVLGYHRSPVGWFLLMLWCAVHAAACLYLGSLLLRRPERSRS